MINKRLLLIRMIGILFLITGLISLFAAPAEFSSFYAFIDGGAYHYEGFGFGSLMFAVIIICALIYAALALICIPVGLGNIRLTFWGYRVSRILFIAMIAVGSAVAFCIGFSFPLFDIFSVLQYIVIILIAIIALVILPYLILRFYKNPNTKQIFSSSRNIYIENQPEHKMVVIVLNLVWVMFFTVMIFLKGGFPFLGNFIFGIKGTYLLSAVIFTLFVLNYLYYRNIKFTKYGMLIFYVFLILSVIVTFLIVPSSDLINMLELPAYEMREIVFLLNIFSGINPGLFFGVLLVIQIVFLLSEKIRESPLF
jgi:hypothetical protein